MAITFNCSGCGKPLSAQDQHAGKMTQCPHCGTQMPIPQAGQPAAVPTVVGGVPAGGPPPLPQPPPRPLTPPPPPSGMSGAKVAIIVAAVVVGCLMLIALLIAILLPSLGQARESARRAKCLANLRGFGNTMKIYASSYNDQLPAVVRGSNGEVDTEASLWLLIETGNASPEVFVCPSDLYAEAYYDASFYTSRGDAGSRPAFPLVDVDGKVSSSSAANTHRTNSYSYQIGNADAGRPGIDNPRATRFAIMADRAPAMDRLTIPPASVRDVSSAKQWLNDLDSDEAAAVNSPNHMGKGQNVLFQDGHASWNNTPWCGIADDNIYTWATGVTEQDRVRGQVPSGQSRIKLGPYSNDDSVLSNILEGEARTGL